MAVASTRSTARPVRASASAASEIVCFKALRAVPADEELNGLLPSRPARQAVTQEEASRAPVAQHIPVRPVGLMGRGGGHGLVSPAVPSALVNDLAVDDRGILGERHRRAAPGCRALGRDAEAFQIVLSGLGTTPERPPSSAFAVGFSGLALAPRRRR